MKSKMKKNRQIGKSRINKIALFKVRIDNKNKNNINIIHQLII